MSAKSAPNLHLFRRCWRCFWRWRRAASTLCHSASGPAQRCGLASKLSACEIWFELPRRSPNASNNWISSSTIINYLIYTYIYIYMWCVCDYDIYIYMWLCIYIYIRVCVWYPLMPHWYKTRSPFLRASSCFFLQITRCRIPSTCAVLEQFC